MSSLTETYFPDLTPRQKEQFRSLPGLYREWNARINVISRRDIDQLEIHHVLHSLSIAKVILFAKGTRVLDVGTGGGFPGIPLAILFPETQFILIDSIAKKIRVVQEIIATLGLGNAETVRARAEEMEGRFDFVTGRAVAALPEFIRLAGKRVSSGSFNSLSNGILYLKGGDFGDELRGNRTASTIFNLSDWFAEDFFLTKKLIHIPLA
jgi:16S rRNA (guanine527-N7)-methyltransferase